MNALNRGDVALVFKGRKVPPGTVGVVVSVKDSEYGVRAGLFLLGGTVVWTAIDNLKLAEGLPPGQVAALQAAHAANQAAYKAASDAKIAAIAALGLPPLQGSPKQVAWADQLRAKALAAGKVTEAEARGRIYAKSWIDNR